jgi:hypothetical protein
MRQLYLLPVEKEKNFYVEIIVSVVTSRSKDNLAKDKIYLPHSDENKFGKQPEINFRD